MAFRRSYGRGRGRRSFKKHRRSFGRRKGRHSTRPVRRITIARGGYRM